jgi:hypothetical protein
VYPAVARRAGSRCEYCHAPQRAVGYRLEREHIIPITRGGATVLDNLALACRGCNLAKATLVDAVDPRTRRLAPLFNPRTERWEDHFRWSRDRTRIIGRTAVGRATVVALRMNDEFRVVARVHWHREGLLD